MALFFSSSKSCWIFKALLNNKAYILAKNRKFLVFYTFVKKKMLEEETFSP